MAPFVPFSAYETLWPGTVHVWPSSVIFQYPIVSRGTGACTCSALVLSCSRLKFRLNSLDRNSIETPTVRPKETCVPVVRDQLMEHSASRSGVLVVQHCPLTHPSAARYGLRHDRLDVPHLFLPLRIAGALPGKPPI
ncbi:hypothetical protein [Streptomyces sp. NPDC090093]|uniref:hypothetical protein n=1 Tax=Streptomyces sp. NPDC090093 TaxID=3365945 RepID=UPI003815A274